MASLPTASVIQTSLSTIVGSGFDLSDQDLIPNAEIPSTFVPFQDSMEIWIYDINQNVIGGEQNFQNYILQFHNSKIESP